MKEKIKTLAGKGNLQARPGSRQWSIAVRLEMQSAIDDALFAIKQIEAYRDLMLEHGVDLLDSEGDDFWGEFNRFASEPRPYGLGCSRELIDEAIALKEKITGDFEEITEELHDLAIGGNHAKVDDLLEQHGFYSVGFDKEHEAERFCRFRGGKPQFLLYSRISDSVWKLEV